MHTSSRNAKWRLSPQAAAGVDGRDGGQRDRVIVRCDGYCAAGVRHTAPWAPSAVRALGKADLPRAGAEQVDQPAVLHLAGNQAKIDVAAGILVRQRIVNEL